MEKESYQVTTILILSSIIILLGVFLYVTWEPVVTSYLEYQEQTEQMRRDWGDSSREMYLSIMKNTFRTVVCSPFQYMCSE